MVYAYTRSILCSKENERKRVKSGVPSIWFAWEKYDFAVTQEQKLGARGHRALLEYSPEGPPQKGEVRLKLSDKSKAPCRDHLGAASTALQG